MAQWYTFTNASGATTDNPNNYSNPQDSKPGCPGSVRLCAILADDDGFGFPVITSQIQADISNALQGGSDVGTAALRF